MESKKPTFLEKEMYQAEMKYRSKLQQKHPLPTMLRQLPQATEVNKRLEEYRKKITIN